MDLTKFFEQSFEKNENFLDAISIVRQNSDGGKTWVVGGLVFRNIVGALDPTNQENIFDFDFIIEKEINKGKLIVPKGWGLIETHFGDPRLVKGNMQIDIWSLNKAIDPGDKGAIENMTTNEKLESYFRRVPLTIQAIAYDVENKKIIGEKGIKAIKDKLIEVNKPEECLSFCKARKISVRNFISKKAKDLNFKAIYPSFSGLLDKETEEFYDLYAEDYEKERGGDFSSFMQKNLSEEVDFFLQELKGKKILDIGSGTGRDALFLKKQGLEPTCIDISSAMVEICKQKGLEAYRKDIEDLDFEEVSFDGVWAYTSLLHIPKKRIYNSLARIREILKEDGLLFLGMVEGEGEKIHQSPNKSEKRRFFALYSDSEVREILKDYFDILKYKRFQVSEKETYLVYVCKKI